MRAFTVMKDQTKIYWQVGYSDKENNFILLSIPILVPFDNKKFSSLKVFKEYYKELALKNGAVFIIVKNKFETHLI